MPTTTQNLCYNCFTRREDPTGPCPYCGFDLEENRQKFPVALRAGTVLNNRYIVGRVLGQGGFGITYVAFDTQLQARVAIKEYMPNEIATRIEGTTVSVAMDTRADDFTYGAERFMEEARTLAKFIGHPNIAGVSSYFDENDTSYFVMDYIEGVSFKSYIANNGGKVSVDETLNVMIPVLRALTAVHAEGFIHRDVTPDNIYISKDGNVKLLDFGSARYSIGDKSKSLDVILKVGYAPKEQYIRRGRQGPFTDVYSCAACFYAALTGYLPPESLERLDQDTLVPVSQCGVDIPDWLDRAILKGLAVQPEDRFQSAAEFLDAIENQLLVEVPVTGGAAPAPARKKPLPLIVGGVAAALAVVIGVGVFLGGQRNQPGVQTPNGPTVGQGGQGGGQGQSQGDDRRDRDLLKAEVPYITIRGEQYSTDLQELNLNSMGLTDDEVSDIKYMINLRFLQLDNNQLTRLPDLSGLPRLENVQAQNNSLTDISGLAGCTALRHVSLGNNPDLDDLSPLTGLTQMQNVNYYNTAVHEYGFLRGMEKLENVQLNEIDENTDLSALSTLKGVKELYLQGQEGGLPDLEFLSGMTGLTTLNLYGNCDSLSLPDLSGLTRLKELRLQTNAQYYTGDFDWSALSGLTGLQSLSIYLGSGYHGTMELSFLSAMTDLRTVELYGQTERIPSLAGLTKLEKFSLTVSDDYYSLTDLSGLTGLTSLKDLSLDIGDTKDFTPLSTLTGLQTLRLFGKYYPDDLTFLSPMTQLRELNMGYAGNIRLTDLAGLAPLTELRKIMMYVDGLTSLKGLEGMSKLEELTLRGNNSALTNLDPLAGLTSIRIIRLPSSVYQNAPVCDLSGLTGLTTLQELELECDTKDLSPLATLTGLQKLTLRGASYSKSAPSISLEPLGEMTWLTELQLSNLNVPKNDLTPIGRMTGLRTLSLTLGTYENPVRDISPLANLTQLTSARLYFTNAKNLDWSAVAHVPDLTRYE